MMEQFKMSNYNKVISDYMLVTGSNVQIFNSSFRPLEQNGWVRESLSIEQNICSHCTGSSSNGENNICREMHVKNTLESGHSGRSIAYKCKLGLLFWVSPIYQEEKFIRILRGSGYLSTETDAELCDTFCAGNVSSKEFKRRVLAFPRGDNEKIQSLAEMLLLCAESLSMGSGNYHETLRLRFEQQASLYSLIDDLKVKYPKGSGLPGYPLETERQLIASLRMGNKHEAEKLLNEVLSVLVFCSQDNFCDIKLRALDLAVLLVRTGTNSVNNAVIEDNSHYYRDIQDSKTVEELTAILYGIIESITVQIVSFRGIPHASALRKTELFIKKNIDRKISLREIAKVAGLSAPYFSTIFKKEMGENLSRYINRQRVEKASKMLLETDLSLSEISGACCFEDKSWFSKIFKSFTGISPGKYRTQGGQLNVNGN
jgi:AraC-like DNA-binding protein/ligand-binding sensor protein